MTSDTLAMLQKYVIPEIQSGDITLREIMDKYNLTRDKARLVMERAVSGGEFDKVEVYDEAGRRCVVLRKKEA